MTVTFNISAGFLEYGRLDLFDTLIYNANATTAFNGGLFVHGTLINPGGAFQNTVIDNTSGGTISTGGTFVTWINCTLNGTAATPSGQGLRLQSNFTLNGTLTLTNTNLSPVGFNIVDGTGTIVLNNAGINTGNSQFGSGIDVDLNRARCLSLAESLLAPSRFREPRTQICSVSPAPAASFTTMRPATH